MRKKKQFDDDNNVTIAEMNVEGMRWYTSKKEQENRKNIEGMNYSKKEKKAMIKGAYRAYLPIFIIAVSSFAIIFGLIYLWLVLHS